MSTRLLLSVISCAVKVEDVVPSVLPNITVVYDWYNGFWNIKEYSDPKITTPSIKTIILIFYAFYQILIWKIN